MPRTDRHVVRRHPGAPAVRLAAPAAVVVALVLAVLGVVPAPAWSQTTTTAPSPTTTETTTRATTGPVEPSAPAAPTVPADGGGGALPGTEPGTATTGTTGAPPPSTTAPPATPTTTTARAPGSHQAAAVPEEAPEGFTDEQWHRVRNVVEACGASPGTVCDRVHEWTGNRALATSAQWLFDIPLRVAIVLAIALLLNWFVRRAIARHLQRLTARSQAAALADPDHIDRSARRMATASATLGSTATVAIFGIAVLIALGELGINLGPMLAGAGIAGIAIGFGAQNLVRDVLSGLFVILEDQYGVGDTIDAGGIASGTVEEFTLRVTKLRDVEGTLWFIPNGSITEVGNKTQLWARAILDIEVAYGADHKEAGQLIKATADRIWREQRPGERIIEEPELWGVERLGESGVAIRLAVKSAPAEQWKVARTLRSEIKDALDAAGFEIPFPQRTIWVRSEDDSIPRAPGAPERGAPEQGPPEQGPPEQGAPEQGEPEGGVPEQGAAHRAR